MAFFKLLKRLSEMAKRKKMKGRSARHGKAASPYQKYQKRPYRYSAAYYDWRRGKVASAKTGNKYAEQARSEQRA